LAADSTIDLAGRKTKLGFANSSSAGWSGKLAIIDWNGLPGGGGEEQLKFGEDESGLTAAQLSQIRFVNPEGFSTGEYRAEILGTGEVVPSTSGMIVSTQEAGKLVLNWSGTVSLQMSTNVAGPYEDVQNATPPFYCDLNSAGQMFFRLKQ
jgi:hypothetical protein